MSLFWQHIEEMRRSGCVYLVHRHVDDPVFPESIDDYINRRDPERFLVFPTYSLAEGARLRLHGGKARN